MRLAIADPPYLGRSDRWYGSGRGSGGNRHRAPTHPHAAEWDNPATHQSLILELDNIYDGWAIAATQASLGTYLAVCPDARVAVWHVTNYPPSGSRIHARWEPVLLRIPKGRTGRAGWPVSDVLTCASPRLGHVGAKPAEWTRWVVTLLGYDPAVDELDDLFPGSGAVTASMQVMPLT